MKRRQAISIMVPFCVLACAAFAAADTAMQVWPADPLTKVFRDAAPEAPAAARADIARGEHASLQFVVRASEAIAGLRVEMAPFMHESGAGALQPRAPRFVGYVPVDRPMQTPCKDQLRVPPADFPDPLLEAESVDAGPGQAQPVWVTIPVPLDAAPGLYRGVAAIGGAIAGKTHLTSQPLEVQVYPVTVARTRLWVTQWFSPHALHMNLQPEPDSDEFYALLARYARNMADHRQNVALISPLGLAAYSVDADGDLAIDFARFDRWVQVFKDAGVIGLIEGGHIGGREGGWESHFVVGIQEVKDGEVSARSIAPDTPEADVFFSKFFPALVTHLKEKGWLEIYRQHLADEPIVSNIESYRQMAALVRKYAPELRIIEACHTKDLVDAMDVWVPQLNYLHDDLEHYQTRQAAGEEVWFYTCVFPQGEYANRFIEQPLIKTRLLHWINFRYGITGYLHWGYNHWTADNPFTHTTRPHGGPPYLPAGDPWIVYPGADGPLDSIRFEAMRDGIVDHELLSMFAEKDAPAAQALAGRFILAFDQYQTDVAQFRAARRELLDALAKFQ